MKDTDQARCYKPFSFFKSHEHETCSGAEVIQLLSCPIQLSTTFILPINVKMPTIFGILTFISSINTTSEKLVYLSVFKFL